MLDGVWENGFFTVFPINDCYNGRYKNELPQDFASKKEAEEYGKENQNHPSYFDLDKVDGKRKKKEKGGFRTKNKRKPHW